MLINFASNLFVSRNYFRVVLFFRGAADPGSTASIQASVIFFAFFAASRLMAAVVCALADPAILFAALRYMLMKIFFISVPLVGGKLGLRDVHVFDDDTCYVK